MTNALVAQTLKFPFEDRAQALLEISEDQWFDRKRGQIKARELADAEIGMANAEGGTIVVGLGTGKVDGLIGARADENSLRQASMDFARPPVRVRPTRIKCVNDQGNPDLLLVLDVPPSEVVHANVKDQVFLRVGDENRKLTFRERQELHFDKGQATFDGSPCDLEFSDLNSGLLESYARAMKHRDPERLLKARGLIDRRGRVTAGAVLLFSEYPQQVFPQAYVRLLRYRGTERGTGARQELLSDDRIEGSIPTMLMLGRDLIQAGQPGVRRLGSEGTFTFQGSIPSDAWLEALVNAVVHRSYSLAGDHVRFEIFDNRIEVESPGRFPGLVDPTDPLHIARFARNPRIARVCADLSLGEELGEGIRRMFDEMRLGGLADPEFRQTAGSVRLILSAEPVDRATRAQLPDGALDILGLLRQARRLSTGEIVDAMGLARPSVLRRLNALRAAGLVEWLGKSPKDPRAVWQIPE